MTAPPTVLMVAPLHPPRGGNAVFTFRAPSQAGKYRAAPVAPLSSAGELVPPTLDWGWRLRVGEMEFDGVFEKDYAVVTVGIPDVPVLPVTLHTADGVIARSLSTVGVASPSGRFIYDSTGSGTEPCGPESPLPVVSVPGGLVVGTLNIDSSLPISVSFLGEVSPSGTSSKYVTATSLTSFVVHPDTAMRDRAWIGFCSLIVYADIPATLTIDYCGSRHTTQIERVAVLSIADNGSLVIV